MRLSLLSLLLLSAAATSVPAAAQPVSEEPGAQAEAPRASERRAPPPRSEPPPARNAGERNLSRRLPTSEGSLRGADVDRPRRERAPITEVRPAAVEPAREAASGAVQAPRTEGWRGGRRDATNPTRPERGSVNWRDRSGERRGRNRDVPPAAGSPVFGSAIPTPGTVTRPSRDVSIGSVAGEGLRRDRVQRESWRREWRNDRRYDWRGYRNRDRARFHVGIYIDPFGWRYRDYDIGWRLPARYYATSYWINDPYYYRLPPVGGPYRWIRYHDDVLLVDLRTGRVLDRIPDFFW